MHTVNFLLRARFLLLLSIITVLQTKGQQTIIKPAYLNFEMENMSKLSLLNAIDSLFAGIDKGNLDTSLIAKTNYELNVSVIHSLKGIENKDTVKDFYKRQLIHVYPVSSTEALISIAYISSEPHETPVLKSIIQLVSKKVNDTFIFSIPLMYHTRNWKTKTVGNITYFFQKEMNLQRAINFNTKSIRIANELNCKPEKFNFYLCENYQEILKLLGYDYDLESNGKTRDGYGIDAHTIFSIMNNEDFSHDVFHYYSAKFRGEIKRNHTVEEGFAYSWGNGYYTKPDGEMVDQKEMVKELKNQLKENPGTDLLELFMTNKKITKQLPLEISTKSILSSLLCNEVERKKGREGVYKLIKCGAGDENFFKVLNELIAINKINFNSEVMKLVEQYK